MSTLSPDGVRLLGAMRRNLELLVELEKRDPSGVATIVSGVVAHLRSWKPLAAAAVAPMDVTTPTVTPIGDNMHARELARLDLEVARLRGEVEQRDRQLAVLGARVHTDTIEDALLTALRKEIATLRAELGVFSLSSNDIWVAPHLGALVA